MATIKGIGWNSTDLVTQTAITGDTIDIDGGLTVDEGVVVTASGVEITAGGLTVTAGGANISGNSSITGNLTVTGNLISQDEIQVLIKDNFIDLNFGNTATSFQETGLTFNYQAVTTDVQASGSFDVTQANLIGAVAPSGTVTITNNTNVTAGDTVSIAPQGGGADVVFTATTSGTPTASEFTIGGNDIATAGNLATQVNANVNFSAVNGGSNTVTITYPTKSATGNTNAITVSDASAMSKTNFASGVDGTTITLTKADSGTVIFTAVSSGAVGREFNIGADDASSATNIANSVNADGDFSAQVDGADDNQVNVTLATGGASGNGKSIATSTATAITNISNFNGGATRAVLTIDTSSNNATFTARSGGTRPNVEFAGGSVVIASQFAQGDIIQIAGTTNGENDGIFVVHDVTANKIVIQDNVNDSNNSAFSLPDFEAQTQTTGNITIACTDLMVLRSSSTGQLQSATGFVDADFSSYTDVGAGSVGLQTAYNNDATVTTAGSVDLAITTTSGNFAIEGGGDANFGQNTSLANFKVDATTLIELDSAGTISLEISGTDKWTVSSSANTTAQDILSSGDDQHDIGATGGTFKDFYLSGKIQFEGANTENTISIPTNELVALAITDGAGGNTFLEVDSSTGADALIIQTTNGLVFGAESTNANSFIDDDTFVTGVDANAIASAESIKEYVDNRGINSDFDSLAEAVADTAGVTALRVVTVTLSGATAGKCIHADNSALATSNILGVALNTATSGNDVYIAQSGTLGGFSSLTAGARQYLGTSGAITETAPSASGSTVYQVGYAISATEIVIAMRHIMVNG